MVGPRMNCVEAVPSDPVVDEAEVMLPPPSTTAHVTVTPGAGRSWLSVTRTTNGLASWAVGFPTW